MTFYQLVNFFIGLLIICNPLSALPALLRLTQDQTLEEKRKIAMTTAMAVGAILLIVTWVGSPLLTMIGISIAAFQVAGGFIIFLLALSMLNAQQSRMKQTLAEEQEDHSSIAVIPLAMPLIAGPGAISMIIVYSHEFPTFMDTIFFSTCALLIAVVMGTLLYFASSIERFLGKSGINIVNRIGGLLLAAIGIESIADGVGSLFPALLR